MIIHNNNIVNDRKKSQKQNWRKIGEKEKRERERGEKKTQQVEQNKNKKTAATAVAEWGTYNVYSRWYGYSLNDCCKLIFILLSIFVFFFFLFQACNCRAKVLKISSTSLCVDCLPKSSRRDPFSLIRPFVVSLPFHVLVVVVVVVEWFVWMQLRWKYRNCRHFLDTICLYYI